MAKSDKSSMKNKILAFSYATKDAIGFSVVGFPVRLNEIALTLTVFSDCLKGKFNRVRRSDMIFLSLMMVSMIQVFLVGVINIDNIDESFFVKYLIRGIMYTAVLFFFFITRKTYNEIDIDYLCRVILIVNLLFFVILYVTGYRMELGNVINTNESPFQKVSLFGVTITRFFGTASESGYLGPFLMMPLYYYFSRFIEQRRNIKELVALSIMLLMTFSAIVYFMSFIVCFIALKKSGKVGKKFLIAFVMVITLVTGILAYFSNGVFAAFIDNYFLNKISAFVGNRNNVFDYSGTDRNMHMQYCIKLIKQQPIQNLILGAGTGAYSHYISYNTSLYSAAEEAYNLYLSTILDRGLFGLLLIVMIGIRISKYHIRNDMVSTAIYMGILCQYIHWAITGNMWLCYFWMEVMYLIGYFRGRN